MTDQTKPVAAGRPPAGSAAAAQRRPRLPRPLALWRAGKPAEAVAEAQAALRDGRDQVAAHLTLSLAAERAGRADEALRHAAEAARDGAPGGLLRWALLLRQGGDDTQALEVLRKACQAAPRSRALRREFAQCLLATGRAGEAKRQLLAMVTQNGEDAASHMALGQALLATGDWRPGWEEYSWRWRLPAGVKALGGLAEPAMRGRAWNGMILPGARLLVVADQGYGDCLQFARFLPWAAERVGQVVLGVSKPLESLLGRCAGVAETVSDIAHAGRIDVWTTLSDLPRLSGVLPATLPREKPYLVPDPQLVDHLRQTFLAPAEGATRTIGLSWAGRQASERDRARSLTLRHLRPLLDLPGCRYVSLQFDREPRAGGGAALAAERALLERLIQPGTALAGFDATAALVASLDLVITIDSATAHLAGGLGRPCWVLLPRDADWRWGPSGERSLWYPSLRLFRQPRPGAGTPVGAAVAQALAAAEGGGGAPSAATPPGAVGPGTP
jgi:hypothetical protein